jgi:hypothetical protein
MVTPETSFPIRAAMLGGAVGLALGTAVVAIADRLIHRLGQLI